ncbi:MAG TPA: Fe(3+) ABC transporter substrate-binding protein [Geminicoccaceae bacterium]|nr:Fe(3+) ABC transporter substrate-binding protein [Geminicoccus sp.]HMU48820.1 Fe(3+) ABC transporter substrate-binding protein [Geminicoccaceae bacterium]
MLRITRRHAVAAVALAASLLAGGAARAEGEVNVYNARHYGTDDQLWNGLTKATGIKVNVVSGNHDELIQRMVTEGQNSPADLFITVDAGRLAFAMDKGVFQPVTSPVLDATIPANLREPSGLWYGMAMRARVIMYDKSKVKPGDISTYEDLADPKWKGQILIRSSTNVYNLSLMGSLLAAHGAEKTEAWCKGLVANMARPPEGGDTDQINAVAAGVGSLAVSNTYYLARLGSSGKPAEQAVFDKIGVIFPNQNDRGTHVNVSGVGVAKYAPNKDNAVKAMEYLASPEAQRYFADVSLEYPANPEVKPHPVLAGFGSFEQDKLNAATFAANSAEVAKIADRCGWR